MNADLNSQTTLSRFVAWMNGLSVFQVSISNRYKGSDFDDDLRKLLHRAGCKGEKICFIMDESNVLESAFLERMNTLLANAEVPGLFEGDEYTALMTACREGARRDGLMLDSSEELYSWFTEQIARNLHVVFTMNPPEEGLASRAATSPALFNRCVIDWFGDWSDRSLHQVAGDLTKSLDLEAAAEQTFGGASAAISTQFSRRESISDAMVAIHNSMRKSHSYVSTARKAYHISPRHFLELWVYRRPNSH